MCLAVPGKIVEIREERGTRLATIDFDGIRKDICLAYVPEAVVGDYVTCGHRCLLHACTIGDEVLVGMGATVMDGAEVGSQSLIGAGALVTRDQIIPPGSLVVGSPARVVRALSEEERTALRGWAEKYIRVSREHQAHLASASPS